MEISNLSQEKEQLLYLPFSFLLYAILIPDISSFICHCHLTLFGDTVLGPGQPMFSLENIRKLMGKKGGAPQCPIAMPFLDPIPQTKRKFCSFFICIGSANTPSHLGNKRIPLGFLVWMMYFGGKKKPYLCIFLRLCISWRIFNWKLTFNVIEFLYIQMPQLWFKLQHCHHQLSNIHFL